jgi:hypothetical protein
MGEIWETLHLFSKQQNTWKIRKYQVSNIKIFDFFAEQFFLQNSNLGAYGFNDIYII